MGTSWNVQIASNTPPLPQLAQQIQATLEHLDREIFTTYLSSSELGRLNASPPGVPVKVSAHMLEVLQQAIAFNLASAGAFDITVGPLVDVWGFGADPRLEPPSGAQIQVAMLRKGIEKLRLDPGQGTALKLGNIKLDLSGIAKGYAVDVIANMLEAAGQENYLVEIGGELRVNGYKGTRQPWQVAIESPAAEFRQAYINVNNNGSSMALAGSGDYRNFRIIDGKHFSHEIDPGTGWPVTDSLAAVTVVAENAIQADAWATALMVQGHSRGLRTANSLGLQAYFIIREENAFVSSSSLSFQQRFKP